MKNPLTSRRRRAGKFTPKTSAQLLVLALLWILWALFSSPSGDGKNSSSADPTTPLQTYAASPDSVRVCTWNVRNYSVAGRRINGKYVQSPKPEAEKKALRKMLLKINADVLLLEEMGDIAFLSELRDDLSKDGLRYDFIATTRYDSPSRLAIMSRIRPLKFVDCCDIKFEFKGDNRFSPRGTLGAKFSVEGVEWYAFAVHLKSAQGARKSDEKFIPFRFAELRAIDRRIAEEIGGCKNVLLAGDFNQEPSAALLRNLKNLRLRLVGQSDAKGLPFTYYWAKKDVFFKYDYFLASENIEPRIKSQAAVLDVEGDASDHRPVYIDLNFSN